MRSVGIIYYAPSYIYYLCIVKKGIKFKIR